METTFLIQEVHGCSIVRLQSADGTNRLTRACVQGLTDAVLALAAKGQPRSLVITGNENFFSAGADLHEIAQLTAVAAYEFSKAGQELMTAVECFPAPSYAAISGYCMGGGLDLALACRYRIASPRATFGHRGAALGLITGWGGTQRLPRLIGKGRALAMFVAAEKVSADQALRMGLIDAISDDPVPEAERRASAG
jgi:enoyl-CoA hydratase/carnithine racemase